MPILPPFPSIISRPAVPHFAPTQRIASQATGSLPAGKTIGSLHQLPSSAVGVQFEFANVGAGVTVYNAAYAVSAGVNDFSNPLNGAGSSDSTLWIPITVGGSSTISVPAGVSTAQPGRVLSDIMSFSMAPLARTDGGSGVLIFFRQYAVSGTHTIGNFDGTLPNINGSVNGLLASQFSQTFANSWDCNGNVAASGLFGTANQYTGQAIAAFAPHAIMPILSSPALTLFSGGDSVLSGVGSKGQAIDSGVDSVGMQMVKALNRVTRPALHRNGAVSGMISSDFITDATNAISFSVPDIILLQTYSENDTNANTNAVAWSAFQRSMIFVNAATKAGARVIVLLSPPAHGAGSPRSAAIWEAFRVYANNLVRASGIPFVDCDIVVGTGTNPVAYQAGMSDDLVHPNDVGAGVLAKAALITLQANYGIF